MEAGEKSVGKGYRGVLEYLEVFAIRCFTHHFCVKIFDSSTLQSLQNIYTTLGIN